MVTAVPDSATPRFVELDGLYTMGSARSLIVLVVCSPPRARVELFIAFILDLAWVPADTTISQILYNVLARMQTIRQATLGRIFL